MRCGVYKGLNQMNVTKKEKQKKNAFSQEIGRAHV